MVLALRRLFVFVSQQLTRDCEGESETDLEKGRRRTGKAAGAELSMASEEFHVIIELAIVVAVRQEAPLLGAPQLFSSGPLAL